MDLVTNGMEFIISISVVASPLVLCCRGPAERGSEEMRGEREEREREREREREGEGEGRVRRSRRRRGEADTAVGGSSLLILVSLGFSVYPFISL